MAARPEIKSVEKITARLAQFAEQIRDVSMTAPSRKKVLNSIGLMKEQLQKIEREVDPIQLPDAFFDPSDPRLVGHFIALALIAQDRHNLSSIEPFYGSGVYAIYYNGPASVYAEISCTETPIYVGKADPPVGAKTAVEQQTKLYSRLNEHRKNIEKGEGIDIADFEFRCLAVQSGYQSAAENHLIRLFRPIWNNETGILFGIGKHGDAATTRANKKSPWDTLHPGRKWADKSPEGKSTGLICNEAALHFQISTIFKTSEEVFAAFAKSFRADGDSSI